ncbi:MAG: diguanylate cyclase [Candidatus Aminicenantes bacterium]|nr:diguanylate cyclase [Candidatus Aminicenantes bacterium]
MKKWVATAFALCMYLLPLELFSQVLPFETFGLRQGIPQSQVSALAQDKDGYLWVGTWGGLARFNGDEFKVFSREDGLHSSRIHELLTASDNTLWIATVGGVSRWRGHRLEKPDYKGISSVGCRALAEDAQQRIWIGTDKGVVIWSQDVFSRLDIPESETGTVYDILADREGILVAAENGLWRHGHDGKVKSLKLPETVAADGLRALAVTAEGLWLGTYRNGLWLYDDNGWHQVTGKVSPRSVYRLAVEPSGTLYIATVDNGLFLKRPGKVNLEHWGEENGLPSNLVSVVLEDREDNLWIGTDIGGLARLSGTAVTNHNQNQGLPSACVFGITAGDSPNSLWLGTMRGAVHYQVRPDPRVIEVIDSDSGLDNNWVWKVLQTRDGITWFLTDTALHFRRRGENTARPLPADVPFPRTNPYDIVLDNQGNLWGCGEWSGGGLARRDAKGVWHVWKQTAEGKPLTKIHRLARSRRGGVFAISRSSFYYCDGKEVVPLHMPSPCPLETSVNITAIMEDSSGRLWAGNDAGLAVMEANGDWRLFTKRNHPGFTNHHVFFVGEDWNGQVWVNTARGVFRFDSQYKVTEFNTDDGLADLETNANGFFSDGRGDIWIGTVSGLSQIKQSAREINTKPPQLVLESAVLPKGRILEYPRSLDLKWHDRTLVFHIAVLSFRNRNRAAYRYRMAGMETEWQAQRRLAELRYTNLPAGNMKLLLQPVNESGIWGEVVTIPIRVRPPFWMTTWFRLAMISFLMAVAISAWRWRTMLLRRRNLELENEVNKRTAELEYLANFDPLTTLLNRRAVLNIFEKHLQPERGPNRQLGCVMIDLNRFKLVNDTLGHAAGDKVLRDMATRIKDCLRQGDELGRMGGDEFLVVLPNADREALAAVEKRINKVSCQAGEANDQVVVTAACGSVHIPSGTTRTVKSILAEADDLLYQAKRSGKSEQD